jgi:hypothetical protein
MLFMPCQLEPIITSFTLTTGPFTKRVTDEEITDEEITDEESQMKRSQMKSHR